LAGACARAAEVFHPEINNKAKREKHVLTCFGIRVLQDAAARISGGYSAEFGRRSSIGLPGTSQPIYLRS
jgi:hypothetical protein